MSLRLIVVAGVLGAEVIPGSLFAQDLSFEEPVAAEPLQHDNYDAAIVIYTKILARNPRDAGAYYDRGVIYLMNGNFANAIADLTQALRLDPNKAAHYSALAVAYAEEGSKLKKPDDCDKAQAIGNAAVQHDAWFFSGYAARGWASLCTAEVTENVSFLDAAIADFTIFIKTTPRNVRAYWGRARAYQHKGESDRAIVDLNQALWLRPQSATTFSERGMSYASNGDYDKAIADFTKSIELSSASGSTKDLAKVYSNRGIAYNFQAKYRQAIADFSKAISLDPTNAYFYGNRATTYFQTRDFQAENADLNRALQCDPKMASAYNDLAWSLATCPEGRFRNGARAIQYATKACEMTQWKNGDFVDTLAAAYAESGQFEEAVKREQRALESLAEEAKINNGRARLLLYQSRTPYREEKRDLPNPGPVVPAAVP